jgi:RimJ/RimL family protein N-acetyltransferase
MSDMINFHISTPRLYVTYYRLDLPTHTAFHWNSTSSRRPPSEQRPPTEADHETVRNTIGTANESLLTDGYGAYLVLLKPTGFEEPVGKAFGEFREELPMIGHVTCRKRTHPDASLVPDVGFRIIEEYTRRGYATEAQKALMEYLRKEKGQRDFFAFCTLTNAASRATLKKIGFQERGLVQQLKGLATTGEDLEMLVWALPHMQKDLGVYGLKNVLVEGEEFEELMKRQV